nr:hypothetical protein [Ardenticatena sp.]
MQECSKIKEEEFYYQEFGYMPLSEKEEKWQKLLSFVLDRADIVEFIVGEARSLPSSLEPFRSSLVKVFSTHWKYGAKRKRPTTYARFFISSELKNFLISHRTIGRWGEGYPEDPLFYRGDELIMWVIGHEDMAFIRLSEDEAMEFAKDGFSLEKTRIPPPYPFASKA